MKKRLVLTGLLLLASVCLTTACERPPVVPPGPVCPGDPECPPPEDLVDAPTYDEDSFQIHYYRSNRQFSTWALWLWADMADGSEYSFNGVDLYGAVASYPLSTFSLDGTGRLGFIVKSVGSWNSKDTDGDRFIDFSFYEKDENDVYHVYLKSGDENTYSSPEWTIVDNIVTARIMPALTVSVATTNPMSSYKIYEGEEVIAEKTLDTPSKTALHKFTPVYPFDLLKNYKAEVVFEGSGVSMSKAIDTSVLFNSQAFNDLYYYEGDDLGAIVSGSTTKFKVWSPLSTRVTLKIYDNGTPISVSSALGSDVVYLTVEMVLGEKGVWSYTVDSDVSAKYYTYTVYNRTYSSGREIVDPYAKGAGVNGARGQIVKFADINANINNWSSFSANAIDRKELVVYETHVQDITSSSTWSQNTEHARFQKTFAGAHLKGTTYTDGSKTVKTGFDHIKALGVNAVQLVPVFDHNNNEVNQSFNWGYNPLNYNVVEGSYSSNPHNGYTRIQEFKQLIKDYGDNGMNIIMDVVYNHVSGLAGSNFDVLLPGYYFRYTATGLPSNGSGCGNETASERLMFRKFMIDSAKFWASEYKLGGFRFDLMGLHDIETMNKLVEELKKINPNIVVYGEPWTGGTSTLPQDQQGIQSNTNKFVGYGQFNDQMRDGLIKGGLSAVTEKGWITNNTGATGPGELKRISNGLKGATTDYVTDPNKVVNYVTCHDNYTLMDRINAAGIKDADTQKKMAMLSNAVVLTSQGTTFMLAGEEFLRTKGGNHNSYDASYKVNELDYSLAIKNADMIENYKTLIDFKITTAALHLNTAAEINEKVSVTATGNKLVIEFANVEGAVTRNYKIVHVNGHDEGNVSEDFAGYSLLMSTREIGLLSSNTSLSAYQTVIAYK